MNLYTWSVSTTLYIGFVLAFFLRESRDHSHSRFTAPTLVLFGISLLVCGPWWQ